jgi:hypothetical protein
MICALLIGREGSRGFPGKNLYPVLGRPMMAYPLLAARAVPSIDRVYLSTDSPRIKAVGRECGAVLIERPSHLATHEALGEEVFVHGYRVIRDQLAHEGKSLEMLALLFCNAPTVTPELIQEGVDALRRRPEIDSAVSVSVYNMWSPLRARREGPDGLLQPFVPVEMLGDSKKLNCDRDSQGDVYFADMGVSVVRPRCLEDLGQGQLPQRWMGRTIYPLKQWGGMDVDYEWQIPMVEFWLKSHQCEPASSPTRPVEPASFHP